MNDTFISVISEREMFEHPFYNVVAFGTTQEIFAVHSALLDAADRIQARFPYTSFLLEVAIGETRQEVEQVGGAFAMDSIGDLFGIPLNKRFRLRDAEYTMSTFEVYCQLFEAMRGDDDFDIDAVWENVYMRWGLLCFRLVLGQE